MRQSPMLRIFTFRGLLGPLIIAMMLACASSAYSSEASTIISRCTHGQSLSGFSQKAYRKALKEISTEVSEYTDCSELIHKAQLAGAGGHSGPGAGGAGGGGSSSSPASPIAALSVSPTEQRAVQSAHHTGSVPVSVGDKSITPGVMHTNIASAFSSLPTPLLVTLIFLLGSAVAVTGLFLRNRVLAHRGI